MKKIILMTLLLFVVSFSQQKFYVVPFDSVSLVSDSTQMYEGYFPSSLLLPSGLTTKVYVEVKVGSTWYWLMNGGAKYYVSTDSTINSMIHFPPNIFFDITEGNPAIPIYVRFRIQTAVSDDVTLWGIMRRY